MNNTLFRTLLAALITAGISSTVSAAPITLGGMNIASQWTDFSNKNGEMPANPWGDTSLKPNSVGFYVEYANGLTGSATYTGLANYWNTTCCSLGPNGQIMPTTATGFFVGSNNGYYAGLHGINNTGFALPAAWTDLRNEYTWNFDLSFENRNNSTWRADNTNWNNVTITLYTSTAAAAVDVPEPASVALFGLGMLGFAAARRRSAKPAA